MYQHACVYVCVRKHMNVKISREKKKKKTHTHYTIHDFYNYKINVKGHDCSGNKEMETCR